MAEIKLNDHLRIRLRYFWTFYVAGRINAGEDRGFGGSEGWFQPHSVQKQTTRRAIPKIS
jgi:hypothetical protein